MNRKQLLEVLNQAKAKAVAAASNTVEAGPSVSSNTGNENFPRGAGRAKLFRPELFNKLTLNSSGEESSTADSLSDNHSTISVESEETKKIDKTGTKGDSITLTVNYIPIECKPNTSIFVYEVRFEPNIHSNKLRRGILASAIKPHEPVFTFDGTALYLPKKLPEDSSTLKATNDKNNGDPVEITLLFKHKKSMKECIHFYNVLFKQVMLRLEYVQFGQKMFDPKEPKCIPHRQLTIWPGYVLACDEFDGGLMLVVDTSHRVLFDTKVSDLLRKIAASCRQHPHQNFKDLVQKSLLGAVVLTPYNNKTYTIHDIDFEQNPMNTFKTKDGDKTYVDYYKTNYGLEIHDLQQPMLISYKERKMIGQNGRGHEDRLTISLLPELTQLTGLTDEMRSDKAAMREIASYIRLTPNQRVQAARKFIAKVNETPSARVILDNWGLRLNGDLLELKGRQLPPQSIEFGNGKIVKNVIGDFGRDIDGKTSLFEVVDLKNWILLYTKQDLKTKQEFLDQVRRCATPMGLHWNDPIEYMLPDDRCDTYATTLRSKLRADTQMAVFICPTSRDDRYSVIKKICCSENPVASQVINARTLANREKSRSIVQKILMQMNCKLGGSLWTIRIPFTNVMICGTDTYHNPNKQVKSVSALVASLNNTYTKWYSKATMQSNREELSHGLSISLGDALNTYKRHNGFYPERIIFYRDGVGDGQLKLCKEFEFPQIKEACRLIGCNPTVTFIVVRKRVHARVFKESNKERDYYENAPAGTVVDHSITRCGLFDFYLVSQNMRHGTATPSHYVVIENECELSPDILQQLSYKLTYQYFNWPGSIRVPAPCQYAHKLAYLIGESIKRETSAELNDKLFYL